MYWIWIVFEKFHWLVLLKYKNNTEAICEWKPQCGEYVVNGTHWQLVWYSTFCNPYITSVYYPYKTFRQFSLALYSTQTSYRFSSFSMRHFVKI